MGRNVGIVGVGQTNHARRRTDVSQAGLVREAVDRALLDAKLTMEDIDAVVVATGPVLFAAVNQPEDPPPTITIFFIKLFLLRFII